MCHYVGYMQKFLCEALIMTMHFLVDFLQTVISYQTAHHNVLNYSKKNEALEMVMMTI